MSFLLSKRPPTLAQPTTSYTAKTIIVTGSNTGLGLEAALKFVTLDAKRVILAVRSLTKGETARRQIEERTKRTGVVEVWELDMASFASVQAFAARVGRECERVDVLVLNAGLIVREKKGGKEGWEETLQVNTLATALLGLLLFSKLKASGTEGGGVPHMVVVTSGMHAKVKRADLRPSADGNILQGCSDVAPMEFDGQKQYGISKLFAMYVVKELATLATDNQGRPEVLVTACCPGFCVSDLGRAYTASWVAKIAISGVHALLARSTEEGSRTLVSAAGLGVEAQGGYWKNDELMR
ncbi:hypothetical protein MMC08_004040 [Hypocenomyce scalaris]|nr:hypothetical protein [Hypocenomyce scalaris]